MARRVTIQDIADELGLSRNTVSKAINNTGILADSTRETILQKAIEMGYKQFSYVSEALLPLPGSAATIAVLTCGFLDTSHFASITLDSFQRELSHLGYGLTIYSVSLQELETCSLPASFSPNAICGIICFEIFDPSYSDMICNLGLPTLFVDGPSPYRGFQLKSNCLLMENRTNIYAFVKEMVARRKKRIGFIGDYRHCMSFYERYMAYREALIMFGIPCEDAYCLLGNSDDDPSPQKYEKYIKKFLQKTKELPDVFICANDFVAFDTMQAFKELHISVPDDVYLCGFDDSPESRIVTPPLTTIHIHHEIMGFAAVHLLMARIKDPQPYYNTTYTETSLIYRGSTGD